MGGALLARWALLDDITFTVLDPARPDVPEGVRVLTSADQLDDGAFDAFIVAVKPQLIDQAVPVTARALRAGGCAISIAAGTSAASVSRACGGAATIRLMPNMPARLGLGISGVFATSDATLSQIDLAMALGEAVGTSLRLADEDQIDRITAAAGSGPGYVFEFARCYQNAAQALGFSEDEARALTLQTLSGCAALAGETGQSFEALRNSIMSEGGTTAAGVAALNADGILDARMEAALQAAYARALELSRGG